MLITWRHIIMLFFAVVFGVIIGAGLRGCDKGSEPQYEDAVVIRDTITLHNTETKTVVQYVERTDTAVLYCHDTVIDTVFVAIPIEYMTYKDTVNTDSARFCLTVDYHGWRAGIDSVLLSYDLRPIMKIREQRRGFGQFVGLGVGVGAGIGLQGMQPIATPTIGLHFVYGFGYHF